MNILLKSALITTAIIIGLIIFSFTLIASINRYPVATTFGLLAILGIPGIFTLVYSSLKNPRK